MSDHNGDPADQAGAGTGGGEDDADLGAPPDPALAARLDTMHRTLSTLGMRIDALVTSTTTYRAALTDRLTEYTELVSKLARSQAADLEEYRRGNERAAAELRRSLTNSDEALQRVTERIEAMAAGGDDGAPDELLAELRTVQESQDRLGRFVTESLDRFGDRVVERIADAQQATASQLDSLRTAVADTGVVEEIREALLDVASGEVVGALWDEFRGARVSIDEVRLAVERAEEAARAAADASQREAPEDPAAGLEPLRADVSSLTDAVRDLLAQAEVVEESTDEPDVGMLTAVASDVAALRTELARGLVVEPSDVLSGAVDQLRDDVAALDGRLDAMAELQQAVSDLRAATEAAAAAPTAGEGEAALARIEPVLDRISGGMGELDARLVGMDERLAGVGGLDGRVAGLDERIGTLGDRLAGLDDVRGGVAQLQGSLRELRVAVDGAAEAAAAAREAGDPDEALSELASVRDSVIALGERLDTIAVLQEAVATLRDEVRAAVAAEPGPAAMSEDLEGELATLRSGVDGVDGELRAVRGGIEDIIARLDEGLVLADEGAEPAPTLAPELADHLAVLRDELAAGFDSLRALAAEEPPAAEPPPAPTVDLRPVTELLEHVRDDLAELPGRIDIPAPPAPEPPTEPTEPADDVERYATLDPDVVDLLREEIRAAGAVPDDLLDQLRQELVALRRRIKLRAEGEILTDDQLELIADAVARRLAE